MTQNSFHPERSKSKVFWKLQSAVVVVEPSQVTIQKQHVLILLSKILAYIDFLRARNIGQILSPYGNFRAADEVGKLVNEEQDQYSLLKTKRTEQTSSMKY